MIRRFFRFIFKGIVWFLGLSILIVLIFKWVPVPITPLMLLRSVEHYQNEENMSWKHHWVPIEKIPRNFQLAVICSEDQNFVNHNGFDFKAIEKAIDHNKKGRRIKGASTISQQTAKNVFLWPQRSWLRKGLEVYFTFLIETIWGKERIMEVYLNSIEMGKSVYGIEAASQHWFGKSAIRLTTYEAAAIVSILPNPRKYRANPPTPYVEGRKTWILQQMRYYGNLTYEITK